MSLKFVPQDLVDNMGALVQIAAWRRSGDKPLAETIMGYITDTYMRHSASISFKARVS